DPGSSHGPDAPVLRAPLSYHAGDVVKICGHLEAPRSGGLRPVRDPLPTGRVDFCEGLDVRHGRVERIPFPMVRRGSGAPPGPPFVVRGIDPRSGGDPCLQAVFPLAQVSLVDRDRVDRAYVAPLVHARSLGPPGERAATAEERVALDPAPRLSSVDRVQKESSADIPSATP